MNTQVNNIINKVRLIADAKKITSPTEVGKRGILRLNKFDTYKVEVELLVNGVAADIGKIANISFEILDIGNINAPAPRTEIILLSKTIPATEISTTADTQNPIAEFILQSQDMAIEEGYKWLSIFATSVDGVRTTFMQGWIEISQNYIGNPNIESQHLDIFLKKPQADISYLNVDKNLSDLIDTNVARENLGAVSESELLNEIGNHQHSQYFLKSDISAYSTLNQITSAQAGKIHFDGGYCEIENSGGTNTWIPKRPPMSICFSYEKDSDGLYQESSILNCKSQSETANKCGFCVTVNFTKNRHELKFYSPHISSNNTEQEFLYYVILNQNELFGQHSVTWVVCDDWADNQGNRTTTMPSNRRMYVECYIDGVKRDVLYLNSDSTISFSENKEWIYNGSQILTTPLCSYLRNLFIGQKDSFTSVEKSDENLFRGKLWRIQIWNCELPENNLSDINSIGYSAEKYATGQAPSPKHNRSIIFGYDKSQIWTSSIGLSSYQNGILSLIKNGPTHQNTLVSIQVNLPKGTIIKGKCDKITDADSTKTDGGYIMLKTNNGDFAASNIQLSHTGNSFQTTLLKDLAEIQIVCWCPDNANTGSIVSIHGLEIYKNGNLLNLSDYTYPKSATQKLLLDNSGNKLDATINGFVNCDLDESIEAIISKFDERYTQNS